LALHKLRVYDRAAVHCQRVYRGYLGRIAAPMIAQRMQAEGQLRKWSCIDIQRVLVRGRKGRQRAGRASQLRAIAAAHACVLQRVWRGVQGRSKFRRLVRAALEVKNSAATDIQRLFRGGCGRVAAMNARQHRLEHRMASLLQKIYRGVSGRKAALRYLRWTKETKSALLLQTLWRCFFWYNWLKRHYRRIVERIAANQIQRAARIKLSRKALAHRRKCRYLGACYNCGEAKSAYYLFDTDQELCAACLDHVIGVLRDRGCAVVKNMGWFVDRWKDPLRYPQEGTVAAKALVAYDQTFQVQFLALFHSWERQFI
jgi:hypothetical protein